MAVITFRTKRVRIDGTDDPNDASPSDIAMVAAAGLPANATLTITASMGGESRSVSFTANGEGTIPWTGKRVANAALASRLRRFRLLWIEPQTNPATIGPIDGLTLTFSVS